MSLTENLLPIKYLYIHNKNKFISAIFSLEGYMLYNTNVGGITTLGGVYQPHFDPQRALCPWTRQHAQRVCKVKCECVCTKTKRQSALAIIGGRAKAVLNSHRDSKLQRENGDGTEPDFGWKSRSRRAKQSPNPDRTWKNIALGIVSSRGRLVQQLLVISAVKIVLSGLSAFQNIPE